MNSPLARNAWGVSHIPIAALDPSEPLPEAHSIRGIVSLLWPYSSSARAAALLLAEPDFRLRKNKGQVRVQLAGAAAKAVAESHVQIGDTVELCLEGASWTEGVNHVKTPGRSVDGELLYQKRIVLDIGRDGALLAKLDVNAPPSPLPSSPTKAVTPHSPGSYIRQTPFRASIGESLDSPFRRTIGHETILANPFSDDWDLEERPNKRLRTSGLWRYERGAGSPPDIANGIETDDQSRDAIMVDVNKVNTLGGDEENPAHQQTAAFELPRIQTDIQPDESFAVPSSRRPQTPDQPRLDPVQSAVLPMVSPIAPWATIPLREYAPESEASLSGVPGFASVQGDDAPVMMNPVPMDLSHGLINPTQETTLGVGTNVDLSHDHDDEPPDHVLEHAGHELDEAQAPDFGLDGTIMSRPRGPVEPTNQQDTEIVRDDPESESEEEVCEVQELTTELVMPSDQQVHAPDNLDFSVQQTQSLVNLSSGVGNEPTPIAPQHTEPDTADLQALEPSKSPVASVTKIDPPTIEEPQKILSEVANIHESPREKRNADGLAEARDELLRTSSPGRSTELNDERTVQQLDGDPSLDMEDRQPKKAASEKSHESSHPEETAGEPDLGFNSNQERSQVAAVENQSHEDITAVPTTTSAESRPNHVPRYTPSADIRPPTPEASQDKASQTIFPPLLGHRVDQILDGRLPPTPVSSLIPPEMADVEETVARNDSVKEHVETPETAKVQTSSLPSTEPSTETQHLRSETPKRSAAPPKRISEVPNVLSAWFTSGRKSTNRISPFRSQTTARSRVNSLTPTASMRSAPNIGFDFTSTRDTSKHLVSSKDPTPFAPTQQADPPLKLEPAESFRTSHSYYTPLSSLEKHLNAPSQSHPSGIDLIAIVSSPTSPPKRANSGPKDFFTLLHVTDRSSPKEKTQVQIFRPFKTSLPVADVGDVIVLRGFLVKSRTRTCFLLSGEASGWLVWRFTRAEQQGSDEQPVGAQSKDDNAATPLEECRGPPVEIGDGERRRASALRKWWIDSQDTGGKRESNDKPVKDDVVQEDMPGEKAAPQQPALNGASNVRRSILTRSR